MLLFQSGFRRVHRRCQWHQADIKPYSSTLEAPQPESTMAELAELAEIDSEFSNPPLQRSGNSFFESSWSPTV